MIPCVKSNDQRTRSKRRKEEAGLEELFAVCCFGLGWAFVVSRASCSGRAVLIRFLKGINC